MSDQTNATKLKDEGNDLFMNKKFSEAFSKYTEALGMGGPNPAIYANRAACRLNMKDYLNAADDAKQAIILDPKYAKAHARLATAHDFLKLYHLSVIEWSGALDCLPKENLSQAELKQREQYRVALESAKRLNKAKPDAPQDDPVFMEEDKTPWVEAIALMPKLKSERIFNSSAWIISSAYNELRRGIELMESMCHFGELTVGRTGGIEAISNAVLQDARVFHTSNPKFFHVYNQQIILENDQYRGWCHFATPTVMKKSMERLSESGWDDVRPALSVTVRGWIIRGFFESGLRQNQVAFSEYLRHAIEIIDWGRRIWEDVHKTDRGVIFESTFLRGVLSLELQALSMNFDQSSPSEIDLENIKPKAKRLLQLVEEDPAPPLETVEDPGFVLAFWNYPKSQALATLGFYHKMKARMVSESEIREDCYREAALYYSDSAACLPEDDENHSWMLSCALSNARLSGPAPVFVLLDLVERIYKTQCKMLQIWSKFTTKKREEMVQNSLGLEFNMEQQLRDILAKGHPKDTLVSFN